MNGLAPLIGLVPAAGRGTRLDDVAGSKELVAVPAPLETPKNASDKGTEGGSCAVAEYLLRALGEAGVDRAYIVLRAGKWDIPTYFANSPSPGPELAYLTTAGTASIPATFDVAYPFVRAATVVTGFADSCFTPLDAIRRAVDRHRRENAAVTLALFPSDRPDKTDMVEVEDGQVVGFRVKPGPCELELTFGAAVWSPAFTEFLHDHLAPATTATSPPASRKELQVSQVLGAALSAGLKIAAEPSPNGRYVDVGTPDDLERVRRIGIGAR